MDWIGHSLTVAQVLFCWSVQQIFFEEPPRYHWPSDALVFADYMKLPYSNIIFIITSERMTFSNV